MSSIPLYAIEMVNDQLPMDRWTIKFERLHH